VKSDYISRSALSKRLMLLAMEGAKGHQRAYAKSINEVETAPDGQMWIDPKREIPGNCDEKVLVIVDGRPSKNIELHGAYQLAIYVEGEGWIVEGYEEWEGADVKWWMPLPELPKEEA
jgi:hypothetical protein